MFIFTLQKEVGKLRQMIEVQGQTFDGKMKKANLETKQQL